MPQLFYEKFKADALELGKDVLTDAYYPLSGSFLDMADYERVVFLIGLDTIVTPDFEVYQDKTATATASIKALTNAAKTDVVTGDDGKWFSIEVDARNMDSSNGFRYLTLKVSGTGGADNANIWALRYRGGTEPVTQAAGYYASVAVVS